MCNWLRRMCKRFIKVLQYLVFNQNKPSNECREPGTGTNTRMPFASLHFQMQINWFDFAFPKQAYQLKFLSLLHHRLVADACLHTHTNTECFARRILYLYCIRDEFVYRFVRYLFLRSAQWFQYSACDSRWERTKLEPVMSHTTHFPYKWLWISCALHIANNPIIIPGKPSLEMSRKKKWKACLLIVLQHQKRPLSEFEQHNENASMVCKCIWMFKWFNDRSFCELDSLTSVV